MKISTLELDFYKKLYEKDIEGIYMEPYRMFYVTFDPIKNRTSSSDTEKRKGESCGTIFFQNHIT